MRTYRISLYTEHLSWCGHEGQLYDLLPLPATYETVRHVAQRIAQVQDYMGEQIGIENASYYARQKAPRWMTPPSCARW